MKKNPCFNFCPLPFFPFDRRTGGIKKMLSICMKTTTFDCVFFLLVYFFKRYKVICVLHKLKFRLGLLKQKTPSFTTSLFSPLFIFFLQKRRFTK